MKFTQSQMQLIAACLVIGFECACDNSVDAGGENTNEDLVEVGAFMALIERHLAHVGDTTLALVSGLSVAQERKPSELFALALALERDAIISKAETVTGKLTIAA